MNGDELAESGVGSCASRDMLISGYMQAGVLPHSSQTQICYEMIR